MTETGDIWLFFLKNVVVPGLPKIPDEKDRQIRELPILFQPADKVPCKGRFRPIHPNVSQTNQAKQYLTSKGTFYKQMVD